MARSARERRVRLWYLLIAVLAIACAVWVFVPGAFVRGIVLGAVLSPAVLLAGLSLIARRFRGRISEHLKPPPLPVFRWDFDMTAQDLHGNRVEFTSFSGKVLVLNFWATWCAPCVAEMPSLGRLNEATSDLGVAVACVTREPLEKVREFVAKKGIDVPVYVIEGKVPEAFESRAIPATFVLDKKGNMALRHFGAAAWGHESVVDFIRGLALAPEL